MKVGSFQAKTFDELFEKTKELLQNPRLSVKEISCLVGYQDANYLTAVFKKWEKISPTDYRLLHRRNNAEF